MTEHDVIDTLRRHRPEDLPDEVVSPHAPAAEALLEEILSIQTIDPAETAAVPDDSDVPYAQHRRRSRRAVTVAGAAAAAVAAVVAASVVLRPADPSAASTVDAAIAQSLESLDVSGRAEVTMHEVFVDEQGNQAFVQESGDIWEYSGDDSSVTLTTYRINGIDAIPGDVDPINRRIDGEFYCYCVAPDGAYHWYHDPGLRGNDDALRANPATLLDQLRPAGDFEPVGTGLVDGAETTRFRASRPADTPAHVLRESWGQLGDVTDLEVWVDDDGLVRRVDIAFADDQPPRPPDTVNVSSATISVRFFDVGEPMTIEAPTDAIELSGEGG